MLKLALLNIAIFQGILLGFILLNSPFFKSRTNKFLAFAILALSWSLLNLVLDITQAFEKYPLLKFVDILDSAVLFPTLVLLFVIHQVNHPKKDSKGFIWLLVPFLISLVYSLLEEFSAEILLTDNAYFLSNSIDILGIINWGVTLVFIPIVLIKTYQFIQISRNTQTKRWLTNLWIFEVIILISWCLTIILDLFIEDNIPNVMHTIALFATLPIHWVAYFGVYKLKLAKEQKKIKQLILNSKIEISKNTFTHTELSPQEAKDTKEVISAIKEPKKLSQENIYYQELERLCLEQRIYRDNTLDRNKVAEMLGISPSYVSQIVNSITNENFATYINRYRVEEVKKLILDKEFDNYSLLSIGLECGFSSKTTYHNIFKKMTGMTPNTYRKKYR